MCRFDFSIKKSVLLIVMSFHSLSCSRAFENKEFVEREFLSQPLLRTGGSGTAPAVDPYQIVPGSTAGALPSQPPVSSNPDVYLPLTINCTATMAQAANPPDLLVSVTQEGKQVCSSTENVLDDRSSGRSLPLASQGQNTLHIPSKCSLKDGTFHVVVKNLWLNKGATSVAPPLTIAQSALELTLIDVDLVFKGGMVSAVGGAPFGATLWFNPRFPPQVPNWHCDQQYNVGSPLAVRLGDKPIEFFAPELGVLFDLLGERALPLPYTKKRVSWAKNPDVLFLALPNNRGEVLGINELFGNNTRLPDGSFTENGFLALKYYDTRQDGVINSKDEVFPMLRLWLDQNRNGVAESSELTSLNQLGLMEISLNYDPHYREVDQYGNQTTLRSLVRWKGGRLGAMFDLWLSYLD